MFVNVKCFQVYCLSGYHYLKYWQIYKLFILVRGRVVTCNIIRNNNGRITYKMLKYTFIFTMIIKYINRYTALTIDHKSPK